ncbi:DNA phosphorothioation-dependent restriction protein DptH [Alteromonas stellipolaris]|uniref:DNA phosphorothioation-dependent restriction protein DptH n=1 Tax=Alteromonas stellipolaris TaxID=233316 RepID=UPI002736913E|nr:DNA phosphorothioation-dependent restriction protein DptH [Alteromonas stellipolaris]MDP2535498.1 DNA phosphorothioation-dependent restriction protein DptH [Alteromonas stellipolaris]
MSEKQFEDFLAEKLIGWGAEHFYKGYRYQFQSPDKENSKKLFQALYAKKAGYVSVKNVEIPFVHVGAFKLLVVLHSEEKGEGYSENFISHIRDVVASQQKEVKDSCLLIIHNSMLDTLINSAENIAQPSWVWHPLKIKKALEGEIDPLNDNKLVTQCLLSHRFEQIVDDGATMFGFEELFNALVDDGEISFHEIALLNDPLLKGWDSPNQIASRLEQNKQMYEKLDYITHHFPTSLEEKLGEEDFSPSFVKKYFDEQDPEAWKLNLELEACLQEQKKNKENLLELEKESISEGTLLVRTQADTKAGRRTKNIIYVMPEGRNTFELEISFIGGKVEKKECRILNASQPSIDYSNPDNAGGKRSRITISGNYYDTATFFTFRVKRDKSAETHNFKVLVLKEYEFYLNSIENSFLIDPKRQLITIQTEENKLQIAEHGKEEALTKNEQEFGNSTVGMVDFEQLASESDNVEFVVKGKETQLKFSIEGAVATDALSLPLLFNQERFNKLFSNEYFAVFNKRKNKIQLDNHEIAPKGKRLTLLQWEQELLDNNSLYFPTSERLHVTVADIANSYPELSAAYSTYFAYLTNNNTLPSLSGWDETYRELVENVVRTYNEALRSIQYDTLLSQSQKQLVNIGFAEFNGVEYITPYHPMVLAYHLYLVQRVVQDETNSFKQLPKVTLSRLNAQGLMPFIYDPNNEFGYCQYETDNSMWLRIVPHQETSYGYVQKLVRDKVSEFRDAFSSLFENGERSKLIINSINNGQNKEVFLGLVDFIKQYKNKACQIHVNIYDDEIEYCEFDRFSDTASYDVIKAEYGLNKGRDKDIADTVIDLLRTRLTYSKFENEKLEGGAFKPHHYAHISFFKNNDKVQSRDRNVNEELSGVVAEGLLAGEASSSEEDSYSTAFGLKGIEYEDKPHLQIAERLNGLIKPARKPDEQYSRSKSTALVVSGKFRKLLQCAYSSSIWTTIIDPKVTLDFFDNDKNVVLIHYSDNYTNSINYDAITVTEESDLYKKVLERDQGGIIEEFNAFNGEWLLKMITANDNERKEKRGIIGAYKFVNCLLNKSDITWVPLSVAEMLRVAGNIGLKMSESDFSKSNIAGTIKGAISDDVLFVGFKQETMVLLPVEVKTGKRQTHNKGVQQAKELKRYLEEDVLKGASLAAQLYRGLFVRQLLMQIDKYKLYNLYSDSYFDDLLSRREWWLQGNYAIADLTNYPEGFLVSHVENDTFFEPAFEMKENILKIELPISNLSTFIKTPLSQLFEQQPEKLCHINSEYILRESTLLVGNKLQHGEDTSLNVGEQKTDYSANTVPHAEKPEVNVADEHNVESSETLKVLVGHSVQNQEPVFWEPTNTAKFMNTNSGIIGTMGTGKTQCTKSVVTQLHRNQKNNVDGKPIGILIFDYKSDYVDDKFINATSGKKYNLFRLPYNPLSLFGSTPMLPVHTARGFSETMAKAFNLGQRQQLKLRQLISQAYDLAGISRADPSTWSKAAPTIADVWALFLDSEPAEDSLYAALESLQELEVFESDVSKCTSLYELIDGITVIELAGYPSEIQSLVVALTLDLFYSQMQKQGKPSVQGDFRQVTKLILVDEADNFMSKNFPSLRKILKEGREYGVGVILSTQDITHFKTSDNDYSAYILSWIVHRVSQIRNQDIKSLFNKDDKTDQEYLMKSIRELEKHHSLYVDGDKKITKIKDRAFWELLNDSK